MEVEEKKILRQSIRRGHLKILKKQVRYLLFYLCVIFVLSFNSFFADTVLMPPSYSNYSGFWDYVIVYIILGFMIFPSALIFNFFINHIVPVKTWARMLAAIFCFVIMGFFLGRFYEFGFYIGQWRKLKNISVLFLSGLEVELIRSLVVRIRARKGKYD